MAINRSSSEEIIKIYFHICRNSNGTNPSTTKTILSNIFNQVVNDFSSGDICFALMGIDFVDDTNINTDMNTSTEESLLNPHLIDGCLNVFFHKTLKNNNGSICGSAYDIPNTYCSVKTTCLGNVRTTSHEIGHCLGLFHTHETFFGEERINGMLCELFGDQVCDTPADPANQRTNACFSNSGCQYTGTCTDPNGQSNYSPPYQNIMSYWNSIGSCQRDEFTSGQFDRIIATLTSSSTLDGITSPNNLTFGPLSSNQTEMLASKNTTMSNSTVDLYSGIHASIIGDNVALKPGFRAHPNSSGKVYVKTHGCP